MKTAEEILSEYPSVKIGIDDFYGHKTTLRAMHEYSQQFKSPYPKMMMVWDENKDDAAPRCVINEIDGYYLAFAGAENIEDSKYVNEVESWLHAKDI